MIRLGSAKGSERSITAFTTVEIVSVGGDGDGHGQNDGGGEQRRPQHEANGVADVGPWVVNMVGNMAVWTDREGEMISTPAPVVLTRLFCFP